MNILIVDDNLTNRKLLHAQLEAEGYEVFEAGDGIEALDVLEREQICAVVSDVLMPRMDGYRLCFHVRKHERLAMLPFIFYTSTFISESDEKVARDLNADRFIRKPASAKEIFSALHDLLEGSIRFRPPQFKTECEADILTDYSERLVTKLEEKNITLQQANAELRATHAQLSQLLQHSPAVIYGLKVKGRNVVPYLVSENIKTFLGFSVQEALNYEWWTERLHPEDCDRAIASVPETLERGESRTEYRLRHKSGDYRWVEDHRHLVRDTSGGPEEIVGVWTNITERKQTERQLLRSDRLESIGTLAGGLAHDLNNALAPIIMATELLRLDYPNTASQFIEVIEASAKRGAEMVKQLLTFAKGTEGERLLIQPRHLLKEVEKLVKVTFPKNIELKSNCAGDLRIILGDATQLHQVLLNLCVNARDAMADGGKLTLRAENIEIDAASAKAIAGGKPGSYVMWSVTDTGAGIPSEILDHIFEPFFSTKGPDKGTGLGLSTAIGIVRSHGGFLQVDSIPEKGSTFTVYLPIAAPGSEEASLRTKPETTFRGHGETVLVVDDEAPVRSVLRDLLTKLNFKVLTATDGTEALIQMADKRAELALVITDFQMPHMDGLTFVRILDSRLPNAKIIVTSGRIEEHVADQFKKLGVSELLEKPFTLETLVAALKKVFQK